jgi:hypothetical protein
MSLSWERESENAMQDEMHEAVNEGETAERNCCAQIVAALKSIKDQLESQDNRQQSTERRKNWMAGLTLAFLMATTLFTGLSWNEFVKAYVPAEKSATAAASSASTAERALEDLERPILMLKTLTATLEPSSTGLKFDASPVVINVGRVAGAVKRICFDAYTYGTLPAVVPDSIKNMTCENRELAPAERILDAKDVLEFPFEKVWRESAEGIRQYVVGQIDYEGVMGLLRERGFGRRYVLPGGYFSEAGGPAYNYDREK